MRNKKSNQKRMNNFKTINISKILSIEHNMNFLKIGSGEGIDCNTPRITSLANNEDFIESALIRFEKADRLSFFWNQFEELFLLTRLKPEKIPT